jgi:choline kinase
MTSNLNSSTLILLVAGFGSRLGSLTQNKPKCLVQIGSKPLLGYWLDHAKQARIQHLVLVVGYFKEAVESFVAQSGYQGQVHFVFNEAFATTNTGYSAHLGIEKALEVAGPSGNFWLADGDLFLSDSLWQRCLREVGGVLVVDPRPERLNEEAMKIALNPEGGLDRLSKDISLHEAEGEFIGLWALPGSNACDYIEFSDRQRKNGWYTYYYEDGLPDLGVSWTLLSTDNDIWNEIDTPEDLADLESMLS